MYLHMCVYIWLCKYLHKIHSRHSTDPVNRCACVCVRLWKCMSVSFFFTPQIFFEAFIRTLCTHVHSKMALSKTCKVVRVGGLVSVHICSYWCKCHDGFVFNVATSRVRFLKPKKNILSCFRTRKIMTCIAIRKHFCLVFMTGGHEDTYCIHSFFILAGFCALCRSVCPSVPSDPVRKFCGRGILDVRAVWWELATKAASEFSWLLL